MNPQISQIQLNTLTIDELNNLKTQCQAAIGLLQAQNVSAQANVKVQIDRTNKQIVLQTVNISKIDEQVAVLNTPVNPA